jgi:hypothetical protein
MWMKGGLDLLLLFFSIAHVFLDGWSDCSFLSHSQLPTAAEHGANGSRLFPFLSSVDIAMIFLFLEIPRDQNDGHYLRFMHFCFSPREVDLVEQGNP